MNSERAEIEAAVVARVFELLATRPRSIEVLSSVIDVEGSFRRLEDLGVSGLQTDEGREQHLHDVVLTSESLWLDEDDPDAVVHRCDVLFADRVLTHRLTEREVRNGSLLAQVETTGHDFGITPDDRPFGPDVGRHYDPEAREETWVWADGVVGGSRLAGSANAGDLLAITRKGSSFVVDAVTPWELGNGRVEIAVLSQFAETLAPGFGYDDFDLLPKVFALDPTVFTRPTMPLPELLGRAGLEVRDGYYGLSRESWSPPRMVEPERDIDDVADRFDFDDCCRDALDQLTRVWLDLRVSPGEAERLDYRQVAEQLSHGSVSLAFEAWTIPMGVLDSEPYLDMLLSVAAIDLPTAAGAHYLLARSLFRRREVLSGVRALERALAANGDFALADIEMASIDFYLGEFARSKGRLQRLGFEDGDQTIRGYPDAFDDNGLDSMGSLRHKVWWYLHSDVCRSQLTMAFVLAFGSKSPDTNNPDLDFVLDLVVHEGGVLEQFLDGYSALLPPRNLEAGITLSASQRDLFEIVDVDTDGMVSLMRVRDGSTIVVPDPGGLPEGIRPHILVRTVEVTGDGSTEILDGPSFGVEASQRRALLDVIDFGRAESGAAMRELLDWYATVTAAQSTDYFDDE